MLADYFFIRSLIRTFNLLRCLKVLSLAEKY